LRTILTFYQCDKCEAKFPTRELAVDHKCAKSAEELKPSHNSRVMPCLCPSCALRAEGCDLENDGVECPSYRSARA
jgi:hypothetical protein